MRSKFSRELPEAVLRFKGPEERVRQSLESLRRLTNANGGSNGAAISDRGKRRDEDVFL